MTINEVEITGKKFRQLIDEATKLWQKISFWTKSSDVEFDDGKNAETKVGAIDGITDSLVSTSSNIAASAKAVSTINNNLGGFTPIIDETGKITGYKTSVGGADTVFPFNNSGRYYFKLGNNADFTAIIQSLNKAVSDFTADNFKAIYTIIKINASFTRGDSESAVGSGSVSGNSTVTIKYNNGVVSATQTGGGSKTMTAYGAKLTSNANNATPFGFVFDSSETPFTD